MAAEIAGLSGVTREDLVVEFGAGDGRLTDQLARRAGRVIAIEIDRSLADSLRHRFRDRSNVTVVHGDALEVPLPDRPFKVVSNPPFHISTALLERMLDEPGHRLRRADVVLAWGFALAVTGLNGATPRSRRWSDRFELLLVRRLPAALFDPRPATDCALVSIRRLR